MKISLIVNETKPEAKSYASEVLSLLNINGIKCRSLSHENYARSELMDSDFVITLGGDGTILRAAGVLAGVPIPILGINVGHLGYLAEVSDRSGIKEAISAILSGVFYLDERTMLRASVYRGGIDIWGGLALNEILFTRQSGIHTLRFHVSCDGQSLADYVSDGILVSTPTGSTAYNLSAGGPILSPYAPVYVMTPICAHSLNSRSVVMDDKRMLEIESISEDTLLALDGGKKISLKKGDLVYIRKADERTILVKISKESFLEILGNKMSAI